jgi:pilus assembly protein Flp/PilA
MHAPFVIVRKFLQGDQGATMVEYGLMTSLIAMAAFSAVVLFGNSLHTLFQNILDDIVAALP